MSDTNPWDKKQVLLPIMVPPGRHCWEGFDVGPCEYLDNEGGHSRCTLGMGFYPTEDKDNGYYPLKDPKCQALIETGETTETLKAKRELEEKEEKARKRAEKKRLKVHKCSICGKLPEMVLRSHDNEAEYEWEYKEDTTSEAEQFYYLLMHEHSVCGKVGYAYGITHQECVDTWNFLQGIERPPKVVTDPPLKVKKCACCKRMPERVQRNESNKDLYHWEKHDDIPVEPLEYSVALIHEGVACTRLLGAYGDTYEECVVSWNSAQDICR